MPILPEKRDRFQILKGDAAATLRGLPDNLAHCCVTSPPYWGMRDYGVAGQIGLERTWAEYVEALVGVFREVRRVLRADGTLWLNLGDCYASMAGFARMPGGGRQGKNWHGPKTSPNRFPQPGLKRKDLCGIPWRVAFALQDDGWYLRRDIIWAKTNPMPESVKDRPSTAHEYLFLLTASPLYFFDMDAVREPHAMRPQRRLNGHKRRQPDHLMPEHTWSNIPTREEPGADGHPSGRGLRSVWTLPTEPFRGAHFATFPTRLVEPCIRAGTSAKGVCPACGAPWTRRPDANGWEPSCACEGSDNPVPAVVLDPFCGVGTAGLVARRLGRRFIGIELNEEYAETAKNRIFEDAPLFYQDPQ